MQFRVESLACAFAFLLFGSTAFAAHKPFTVKKHHYDSSKSETITGTVTKVEWQKPYVKIHMDVSGSNGKTKDWEIQTAAPNAVEAKGLTKAEIKAGDQITVQGNPASNGSAHLFGRSITLANNQTVAINEARAPEEQEVAQTAPTPETPGPNTALPRTASDWPIWGLVGLGALAAWAALSFKREA